MEYGAVVPGVVGARGLPGAFLRLHGLVESFTPASALEDAKALEPAARKVDEELDRLTTDAVTDPGRIAQAVRRTVGKWVGETYRRQPMIVPTVIEI